MPVIEEAETLGIATNNVAEYTALVRALERANALGLRSLAIFSDSELMVRQMKGEYRVKSADLQDLYREAVDLRKAFDKVTLTHVRREFNSDADRLCNEALDGRPRPRPTPEEVPEAAPAEEPAVVGPPMDSPPAAKKGAEEVGDDHASSDTIRSEAFGILTRAAADWSVHGPHKIAVGDVWDELWALLKKHDALKKKRTKKEPE
ncbi:ribonuclease H [Fimbriiglobus ruber]|uniref:Ribonuclease H n=1 Tax=Fimbriiglobus ruber TaxID=1908690 RepID=A0A225E6T5_9BACT|nr:ribonuclease H [Fimbriiglobus ruber]